MTNGPDSWNRISEDEVRLLMRTGEEDPRPTVAEVAEAMSVTEDELRHRLADIRSQRLSELEKEVLRLQDENQRLKAGLADRASLGSSRIARPRERGRSGFAGFVMFAALVWLVYMMFVRSGPTPVAPEPAKTAPAPILDVTDSAVPTGNR